MASIAQPTFMFIGLDVNKDSISAGILESGGEHPTRGNLVQDEASIRRWLGRFCRLRDARAVFRGRADWLRA